MPGKSVGYKNDLLRLFFNATATAGITIPLAVSTTATSFWLSLHTAAPGTASNRQDLNETTYSGYQRLEVIRTSGFAVSANSVTLAANQTFATASSSGQTITHWGIGSTSTGTGYLYYGGTCTPTVTIDQGVIPILTSASRVTED